MAGMWRRIAAGIMLAGGFADASLARPEVPHNVDALLFAVGVASLLCFFAFERVTWPRLGLALIIGVASIAAVVRALQRGATGTEMGIGAIDITLRIALGFTLLVLWARHLREAGPRRRRRRHHRASFR